MWFFSDLCPVYSCQDSQCLREHWSWKMLGLQIGHKLQATQQNKYKQLNKTNTTGVVCYLQILERRGQHASQGQSKGQSHSGHAHSTNGWGSQREMDLWTMTFIGVWGIIQAGFLQEVLNGEFRASRHVFNGVPMTVAYLYSPYGV